MFQESQGKNDRYRRGAYGKQKQEVLYVPEDIPLVSGDCSKTAYVINKVNQEKQTET